jgi:hypothetical protein
MNAFTGCASLCSYIGKVVSPAKQVPWPGGSKKILQFIDARFVDAKLFAHYVTPPFPVSHIHFLFY